MVQNTCFSFAVSLLVLLLCLCLCYLCYAVSMGTELLFWWMSGNAELISSTFHCISVPHTQNLCDLHGFRVILLMSFFLIAQNLLLFTVSYYFPCATMCWEFSVHVISMIAKLLLFLVSFWCYRTWAIFVIFLCAKSVLCTQCSYHLHGYKAIIILVSFWWYRIYALLLCCFIFLNDFLCNITPVIRLAGLVL